MTEICKCREIPDPDPHRTIWTVKRRDARGWKSYSTESEARDAAIKAAAFGYTVELRRHEFGKPDLHVEVIGLAQGGVILADRV